MRGAPVGGAAQTYTHAWEPRAGALRLTHGNVTRDGNGRWRARSRVDENRCARRPLTSIRLGPFRPYKRLTLEPHPRVSPGCRYEREYQSLSSCFGAPRATRAAVDPSRKEDWTCKFSTSGALLSMSVRM